MRTDRPTPGSGEPELDAGPRKTRSLRSKIVLVLTLVAIVYAGVDHLLQRFMVQRTFETLEVDEAQRNLQRATAGIHQEADRLASDCRRWAAWEGAQGLLERSEDEELRSFLIESDLHLLYLCAPSGRVRSGGILHPETLRPIALREFPSGALLPGHPLLPAAGAAGGRSGLLPTERGLMFVASHPIPAATPEESPGSVLVGRFLDTDLAREIGERVQVRFQVWPLEGAGLPELERGLVDRVTGSTEAVVEADDELLRVYSTQTDVRMAPSLLLRVDVPRDLAAQGRRVVFFAQISTAATSLLLLTVLLLLLQAIVVRPLVKFTRDTVAIGQHDDPTIKTDIRRNDEIGLLSAEFDRMLDKLADARAQNIRTARTAGMSEIATGVLHNIGNVLNSVNVSTSLAERKAKELSIADMERMLDLVERHDGDLASFIASDARGEHLLPFLKEVTGDIRCQRDELCSEISSLRANVDHIAELVRSQQSFAVRSGTFEKGVIGELVDRAIAMSDMANRPDEIEIVRDYEDIPPIPVDTQKLVEIFINLIQNARQAVLEKGGDGMRILVRSSLTVQGRVRVEFRDNGIGISEENLTRIFHHGFTTKKKGHGFGLHVSANWAVEMGGSLRAESDGPGKGAAFILEIPAEPEARNKALEAA